MPEWPTLHSDGAGGAPLAPECFRTALELPSEANAPVLAACQLQELFTFLLEEPGKFKAEAKDLGPALKDLVLGLGRMPVFTTFIRVPPK